MNQQLLTKCANGTQEAFLVVECWKLSVSSLLDACVRIRNFLTEYEGDKVEIDAFIHGLVEGGVLTANEGKKGISSPQLSKLRSIGEHIDLFERPEIRNHLPPDYTTLYQLTSFYKTHPGKNVASKEKAVLSFLQANPEVTRDVIQAATKKNKSKNRKTSIADKTTDSHIAKTLSALLEAEERYDLVLITPNHSQLRQLCGEYDFDSIEACLPLHRVCEEAGAKAVVVVAPLGSLPAISKNLMPVVGFGDRATKVFLIEKPSSPDVTSVPVVFTSQFGQSAEFEALNELLWSKPSDATSRSEEIASAMYPSLKKRIHVFADREANGWTTLIGDDSWVEPLSVK